MEPPEEVKEATELALALLNNFVQRGMEYEEWEFELEGGPDDGGCFKVLVMKAL